MHAAHDPTISQLDKCRCDSYGNDNLLTLDTKPSGQGKQLFGMLVKNTTTPRYKDYWDGVIPQVFYLHRKPSDVHTCSVDPTQCSEARPARERSPVKVQ